MKLLGMRKSIELCSVILNRKICKIQRHFTGFIRYSGCFRPFCDRYVFTWLTFYDRLFRYNGFYGAIGYYDSYAVIGIRTDNRRPFER